MMLARRLATVPLALCILLACRNADHVTPPRDTEGSWPNRPPGTLVLTDQSFAVLAGEGWNFDLRTDRSPDGRPTLEIGSDESAPFGAPDVLRFRFPPGMPGGGSVQGRAYFTLHHLPAHERPTEIYAGMWLKVSEDWQGHASSINKLLNFNTASDNFQSMWTTMRGPPSGPFRIIGSASYAEGCTGHHVEPNMATGTITPGRWHQLEIHHRYASRAGANDGLYRVWLDDVLAIDVADLCTPPADRFAIRGAQLHPVWGGVDDAKRQEDTILVSHVLITGR